MTARRRRVLFCSDSYQIDREFYLTQTVISEDTTALDLVWL